MKYPLYVLAITAVLSGCATPTTTTPSTVEVPVIAKCVAKRPTPPVFWLKQAKKEDGIDRKTALLLAQSASLEAYYVDAEAILRTCVAFQEPPQAPASAAN